ncbi:putative serine/threonine-protein kinase [Trypanosoma cruzi]|uniref:Aurora kinase n=2 Tax=Trypanosoma cruzi TaxID=5693 RepID=Q4DKK3_TRYCC|nr:serine/threonine protein kinase, putative [Trypanosoma cruzi]ACA50093.1 aurora kinase 2l [Trypanosoma cruzi]EAN93062.1 serine/threonine protein kinase, putative [Trypanosoma cruzi]PWV12845.1 putative serine/threonine-protein kinase [Trypanosoma cruzi]RNC44138.1 putative serine/threonine protein kinase, putative,protein kinase [Trypanosoma cruzi]|eukprot:XP_814913.1 serine/threonine protein kinase [Trypanosoma cruzi strain CL Brener]
MWQHHNLSSPTLGPREAKPTVQTSRRGCTRSDAWCSSLAGGGHDDPSESVPNSRVSPRASSFAPPQRTAPSPTESTSQGLFELQHFNHHKQQQQQQQRRQKQQLVIRQEDIRDDDFQRLEVLGDGSYSVVVSARHLPTQQLVALKEVSRRRLRELKLEKQLQWEINVHRTLRHPNVVRMLSYYITPQTVVLVLEMCPGGTLLQKLKTMPGGRFDERRASRYVRQAARALTYLHGHGIAHRDLKLENIFLDAHGVARLGDFGWSKALVEPKVEQDLSSHHDNFGTAPCSAVKDVSPLCSGGRGRLTVCGTLDYLSPEMLIGMPHTFKTDVWSLGVMLAEMLTGAPPFYCVSQQDTLNAIREAAPHLGDDVQMSSLARELVLAMLQKNPDARPTMAEVLQHPWTRQNGEKKKKK